MMTTSIQVVDLVGPVCVDPVAGDVLRARTNTLLSSGVEVVLDFSHVRTLTSSFLNAAIGCLFESFSVDTISCKLRWVGLDDTDQDLVKLVLRNAARFYSVPSSQQADLLAIWDRASLD